MAGNNARKWFFNFLIFFFYVFRNFPALVVWTEFGTKFFFSLSQPISSPVLAKHNAGKGYLIFWIFFSIFFRIFLPGSSTNGIRDKFFFFSFLASLSLFRIMLDRGFLIFWFFLLFFSEYSCPGWVWTEFGTKIFLSLSQPISTRFG